MKDKFIVTHKNREYTQAGPTPKISIDRATYDALLGVAVETGRSLSEVARMAISFALKRLSYDGEESWN